jgi:starvation-inducible outer membrane lipoprotein
MNLKPMVIQCVTLPKNILSNTNIGLNVNIVTNKKMIKQLVLAGAIVLSGCATQTPTVTTPAVLPYYAMDTFKADCLYGDSQRRFLEERIREYNQYHQTRPATEQGRDYYTKLKNALWGLRSACGANR